MSPERLAALQRQRELVAQHLAWLDLELALAKTSARLAPDAPEAPTSDRPDAIAPVTAAPEAAIAPVVAAPEAAPAPSGNAADEERLATANARANAILEEYSVTERFNPDNTRRGCLLFAIAVLLLGFTGILLIYILRYR